MKQREQQKRGGNGSNLTEHGHFNPFGAHFLNANRTGNGGWPDHTDDVSKID
jgi:hypothetical protein